MKLALDNPSDYMHPDRLLLGLPSALSCSVVSAGRRFALSIIISTTLDAGPGGGAGVKWRWRVGARGRGLGSAGGGAAGGGGGRGGGGGLKGEGAVGLQERRHLRQTDGIHAI